jgi:hypothetical protein
VIYKCRHISVNIQPREAVNPISNTVYGNAAVSTTVIRYDNPTFVRVIAGRHLPRELSRFQIVVEKLFQSFPCQ